MSEVLHAQRREHFTAELEAHEIDGFIGASAANVDYLSGYRSVGSSVHGGITALAVARASRTALAAPVSDAGPALFEGTAEDDFFAYGRFFFESEGGRSAATRKVEEYPDLAAATVAAIRALGLESARIGLDERVIAPAVQQQIAAGLPAVTWADSSAWMTSVRSSKQPAELMLLEHCATATEAAIDTAIRAAAVGITERDLAGLVGAELARSDVQARFVVVSSGPRSALADCWATDRALEAGDLVRFDIGGQHRGYWSDLGRTAVVGEPDARQARFYQAILDGEQAQYDILRPGVTAAQAFDIAVQTVQQNGPSPYRRQHCGHGIGLEVYEAPIITSDEMTVLQPGMTFCFETPYYELGWGGMMIEDTVVLTEDGFRFLHPARRELQVIEA